MSRATPHMSAIEKDDEFEEIVLAYLLADAPVTPTVDEVVRALANDPDDFSECDGFKRAIQRLRANGLVHRPGDFVLPTIAGHRAWTLFAG